MDPATLRIGDERKAQILEGIRRCRSACGCEFASLFMVGAAVLSVGYWAYGSHDYSVSEAAWRGFLAVLSAAVVGKLLGLAYARLRLRILRAALRTLEASDPA